MRRPPPPRARPSAQGTDGSGQTRPRGTRSTRRRQPPRATARLAHARCAARQPPRRADGCALPTLRGSSRLAVPGGRSVPTALWGSSVPFPLSLSPKSRAALSALSSRNRPRRAERCSHVKSRDAAGPSAPRHRPNAPTRNRSSHGSIPRLGQSVWYYVTSLLVAVHCSTKSTRLLCQAPGTSQSHRHGNTILALNKRIYRSILYENLYAKVQTFPLPSFAVHQ